MKEMNLLDNSSDYDMKITGNRYSGFQSPHDKIFGTTEGIVSVEDKIFGKSRTSSSSEDKIFGNVKSSNKNLFNQNTNVNMSKFFNNSSSNKNNSGHNKINMMLGGNHLNSNKIIGNDKKSKSNIADNYDMNKYFSMNPSNGNNKISMMLGGSKQNTNNNLNFENKMKMFLPGNNSNNLNTSNKLNMYLPKRIGRDIYGRNKNENLITGDSDVVTVVSPTGEAAQTYGKQDTDLNTGLKTYDIKPTNINIQQEEPVLETYGNIPTYQVKKENKLGNFIKGVAKGTGNLVVAGAKGIANLQQDRVDKINMYKNMQQKAYEKYMVNPKSLTLAETQILLQPQRQGTLQELRSMANTGHDNLIHGLQKSSLAFSDVGAVPFDKQVNSLMGGWRDFTKVPTMRVGGAGRDQIFKQGKKNFIMTPEGPVEVPKGYASQIRGYGQTQQYEKIHNPIGIFSSKVDFAMPTSQPTNIPVVQYMSRIPQGTGGFETMSKIGSGQGFNVMSGIGNIEMGGASGIDNTLNSVMNQIKTQPQQPVSVQPTYQPPQQEQYIQPQQTQYQPEQRVQRPSYSTGPKGQPPQPGMKWSEHSKKWVWYERTPYTKHTQQQPQQQYGG
jgi:hypothetical protein